MREYCPRKNIRAIRVSAFKQGEFQIRIFQTQRAQETRARTRKRTTIAYDNQLDLRTRIRRSRHQQLREMKQHIRPRVIRADDDTHIPGIAFAREFGFDDRA